jgi:D-tyrosyl-tRNA(Tyr) deacylase
LVFRPVGAYIRRLDKQNTMRVVVQRTTGVEVWIDDALHSVTGPGLMVLFGTRRGDAPESANFLADKVVNLRIFEDQDGRMNRSALDERGEVMVVSQFTLYADTRKGRRPAFTEAMEPVEAERLYNRFVDRVAASGLVTQTGRFGARMNIKFTNCGPVTIICDHDV